MWLPALAALAVPGAGWEAAAGAFAARWRGALLAAAAAGLAASLLGLALQAAVAEGTTFWAALGDAPDVLSTRFGTVWGLGALAWLAVGALALPARAAAPAVRPATVGAAGVAVARAGRWTAALARPARLARAAAGARRARGRPGAGRRAAAGQRRPRVAASAWIGGLALLVARAARRRRAARAARPHAAATGAVGRFSALAPVAVALLLAGGILQSVLELDALDDLWDTAYGRAIIVKSVLVLGLLALGWRNRRRTLPALGPRGRGGRVARPPRPHAAAGAPRRGGARRRGARGDRRAGRLLAVGRDRERSLLGVRGPRPGAGRAHRRARDGGPERGPPVPLQAHGRQPVGRGARQLTVHASLPSEGIAPIALDARKAGPGHYVIGGAPLAPAGDWRLAVDARVSEFDQYGARFTVPVR